ETLAHLFFTCTFSQWCWRFLHIRWDLSQVGVDMIIAARRDFNSRIFREILMVACWAIWKHRNEVIFDGVPLSLGRWKSIFREEFSIILHRAKPYLKLELETWFCNFR
ncbi:hypothetical protein SETIT_8G113200v2, partial [Setaria italica]